jgi:hypothetical protein
LSFLQGELASYSFKDENGNEFIWNDLQVNMSRIQVFFTMQSCCRTTKHIAKDIKYIPEGAIWEDYHTIPENNLLQYLRTKHIAMTKIMPRKLTSGNE